MNRYLEEYDTYIDYYNDTVFTGGCSREDVTDPHLPDPPCAGSPHGNRHPPRLTPQQAAVAVLQCQSCQDNKGAKNKKGSKPLRSSKSFMGIRKSRSAEALQSLRINPVDSVFLPKSPSCLDTKAKGQSKGKIRTFARWLITKTTGHHSSNTHHHGDSHNCSDCSVTGDNNNALLLSQPSSSSLVPSVSSCDDSHTGDPNTSGYQDSTSGYQDSISGSQQEGDGPMPKHEGIPCTAVSNVCDNVPRRGSTDCVLDRPQCACPRCVAAQAEGEEAVWRPRGGEDRLLLRLGSLTEHDRASCYYKYQSIRRSNPKSKHLSIGRKKFNMDPKKGIEYLIEHELLQNTSESIAQFLHKGEGLNKTAIGDYLGERNDFNIAVLKDFVSLHEFADMILVQALRQFLWSFRLPGEAQKIDRMMESFAQRYCNSNPDVFTSTDTCYVLSFSIIMLNTSLHNPAVKDKPNIDRFISMNRGINDGGDLPQDLLTSIYENIKKEPFKFPEDDGNDLMHTFFNPDKEGSLWKQGGRYKNWKRRWFILNDNCLYYFQFTTDKEPKGIIPLENIQVREVPDQKKTNCFELFSGNNEVIKACKTDSEGKVVEGKHHVYRMSASTPEEKEEWIKCIRASISEHPFYDMLAARRKKAQMKGK